MAKLNTAGTVDRYLFIINPISGGNSGRPINFQNLSIEADYINTERMGHATQIVKENLHRYDVFVVVGGDGTINEVAKPLIGTDKILGIIPKGSGNGLGRSLGISLNHDKALETVINGRVRSIDTGVIDNKVFLNVAGVGFDGVVSHDFARSSSRGLINYIRSSIKKYFFFRGVELDLNVDGDRRRYHSFLMSFANSDQWGNDFKIASDAKLDDGKLNLTVIPVFHQWQIFKFILPLIRRKIDSAPGTVTKTFNKAHIRATCELEGHLDGEPVMFPKEFEVEIVPASLRVLVS